MQTWNKTSIQSLLLSDTKAMYRAISKIYERQTDAEQCMDATVEQNGIGFNGVDAPIMSSFAKQLAKKGFLTDKQFAIAKKKMPKYWAQILHLINEKASKA